MEEGDRKVGNAEEKRVRAIDLSSQEKGRAIAVVVVPSFCVLPLVSILYVNRECGWTKILEFLLNSATGSEQGQFNQRVSVSRQLYTCRMIYRICASQVDLVKLASLHGLLTLIADSLHVRNVAKVFLIIRTCDKHASGEGSCFQSGMFTVEVHLGR